MRVNHVRVNFRIFQYMLVATLSVSIVLMLNAALYAKEYDIPDPEFRKVILKELGKTDGELTKEDYEKLAEIDFLSIFGGDIQSLEGIQNLTSLSDLSIFRTQVKDFTPLRELKKLEYLSFYSTPIIDISPLSGIKSLKMIFLNDSQIVDFSSLSELPALYVLSVGTSHPINLESLARISNLTELEISYEGEAYDVEYGYNIIDTSIQIDPASFEPLDISHLKFLTKLENLLITYPNITNVETLRSFPNLRILRMILTKDTDLKYIAEKPELEELDLYILSGSDITPLLSLTNLKTLSIGGNDLKDLSPLLKLNQLEKVNINVPVENMKALTPQILEFRNHGINVTSEIESRCILTLRALGSSNLAYQDQNPDKNYGTWEEMTDAEYIQEGYDKNNIIDNYRIVVFNVTPSEKDSSGKIIKESRFTIVAVPSDQYSWCSIYAIDDSQTPKKWIGENSKLDINNIDLSDETLWKPVL